MAIFARLSHSYSFHGIMGSLFGDAVETIVVMDLNSKGRKPWSSNT